jgi:hypothetical protein
MNSRSDDGIAIGEPDLGSPSGHARSVELNRRNAGARRMKMRRHVDGANTHVRGRWFRGNDEHRRPGQIAWQSRFRGAIGHHHAYLIDTTRNAAVNDRPFDHLVAGQDPPQLLHDRWGCTRRRYHDNRCTRRSVEHHDGIEDRERRDRDSRQAEDESEAAAARHRGGLTIVNASVIRPASGSTLRRSGVVDGTLASVCAVTAPIAVRAASRRRLSSAAEAMPTAAACNSADEGSRAATLAANVASAARLPLAASASACITERSSTSVAPGSAAAAGRFHDRASRRSPARRRDGSIRDRSGNVRRK